MSQHVCYIFQIWIPYGKSTTRRIESAYKDGKTKITLKGGYFATAVDTFKFHLDKPHNRFYQINMTSRRARAARRRSGTDALVVVDVGRVDAQDRCVMCQERCFVGRDHHDEEDHVDDDEHAEEEEEEQEEEAEQGLGDDEVVKLARCADGHYFHRGCISGYLLLRNTCPVCFQPATVA
ncbi:hypothetical protein HDU86_001766 [Geranomyces michiganensis]|nr:hypothetical protein HDU86_001766 [Geranomyces michiganensis]